jgi:hypothetical protein
MKYILSSQITVSAYCEVEANSPEEAISKSKDLQPSWHSHDTGTSPDEVWCVEEIDGTPCNITIQD